MNEKTLLGSDDNCIDSSEFRELRITPLIVLRGRGNYHRGILMTVVYIHTKNANVYLVVAITKSESYTTGLNPLYMLSLPKHPEPIPKAFTPHSIGLSASSSDSSLSTMNRFS